MTELAKLDSSFHRRRFILRHSARVGVCLLVGSFLMFPAFPVSDGLLVGGCLAAFLYLPFCIFKIYEGAFPDHGRLIGRSMMELLDERPQPIQRLGRRAVVVQACCRTLLVGAALYSGWIVSGSLGSDWRGIRGVLSVIFVCGSSAIFFVVPLLIYRLWVTDRYFIAQQRGLEAQRYSKLQ